MPAPTAVLSFADLILQGAPRAVPQYMDVSFIACTSVLVESLFSQAGFYFDARRLGSTPEHIEQQMFLNANRDIWTTATVNRIYERNEAANKARAATNRNLLAYVVNPNTTNNVNNNGHNNGNNNPSGNNANNAVPNH